MMSRGFPGCGLTGSALLAPAIRTSLVDNVTIGCAKRAGKIVGWPERPYHPGRRHSVARAGCRSDLAASRTEEAGVRALTPSYCDHPTDGMSRRELNN